MNNWSPERRRKFVALVVGTLIVLIALWQGGIGSLQEWLRQKRSAIDSAQARLRLAQSAQTLGPQYEAEVAAQTRRLQELESRMAHGDLFRWVIHFVLNLQDQHDSVTATSWQPAKETDLDIPPAVSYKAVAYSFNGTARYHDFGAFLAHLENSSPMIRLRGVNLQASAPGFTGAMEPERLAFQVDFTTLVSTNTPNTPSP